MEAKGSAHFAPKVEKQARVSSDAISQLMDQEPKPCADAVGADGEAILGGAPFSFCGVGVSDFGGGPAVDKSATVVPLLPSLSFGCAEVGLRGGGAVGLSKTSFKRLRWDLL